VRSLARTLSTPADGRGSFLASVPDETLDAYEAWAAGIANAALLGSRYTDALAWLVVHRASKILPGGASVAGSLTGASDSAEGAPSRSRNYTMPNYQPKNMLEAELMTTGAGMAYLTIAATSSALLPITVF
jgi:hypothetical protein